MTNGLTYVIFRTDESVFYVWDGAEWDSFATADVVAAAVAALRTELQLYARLWGLM